MCYALIFEREITFAVCVCVSKFVCECECECECLFRIRKIRFFCSPHFASFLTTWATYETDPLLIFGMEGSILGWMAVRASSLLVLSESWLFANEYGKLLKFGSFILYSIQLNEISHFSAFQCFGNAFQIMRIFFTIFLLVYFRLVFGWFVCLGAYSFASWHDSIFG